MWMNEYEIEDAVRRFNPDDTPNLLAGAQTLERLMRWTNRNSDGWPYWKLPANAANKLMDLLQSVDRWDPKDCTEAELRKAYSPIKAFLTRHGSGADDVFPPPGPVEYVVSVHNGFTAESPVDAVGQMAAWLSEQAYAAGYRVQKANGVEPSVFIDAEKIDWEGVWKS